MVTTPDAAGARPAALSCFECPDFPCANLAALDARHVRDDHISMIANLLRIQEIGVEGWLKEQADRWRCPECGGALCVMDGECYDCGEKTMK